jgi:hypothetical protein
MSRPSTADEYESVTDTGTRDTPDAPARSVSRRTLLTGLATGSVASTTGCLGRLPSVDPPELRTAPIAADDPYRVAWGFPAETADSAGRTGYVAVSRRNEPTDAAETWVRLDLNASSTLSSDRQFDRYRFRLRLPQRLHDEYGPLRLYARPPVAVDDVRVARDTAGTDRGVVVDHRSVQSDGTLITEAVLGPRYEPFPPVVDCAFAGRLSTPGALGETARVKTSGRLRLRPDDEG